MLFGKSDQSIVVQNKECHDSYKRMRHDRAYDRFLFFVQISPVVSSFADRDIDLERSSAEGVRLLKNYLCYANYGGKPQNTLESEGLNPIEQEIFNTLEKAGIPLVPKFGFSQYKIDMVAKHPTKDEYVLAIECDGEYYASSPTAKERDRLREQQLASLGWKFYRIWLLDWINNKEQEIERIKKAYQEAL